jgi:hypothetical protein
VWWYACGDCHILFQGTVTNADPSSFHPECPSCADKLLRHLAERDAARKAGSPDVRGEE